MPTQGWLPRYWAFSVRAMDIVLGVIIPASFGQAFLGTVVAP